MPKRPTIDERVLRKALMRPLFEEVEKQGRQRIWLAARMGISKSRLWTYEHGTARIPRPLLDAAAVALGTTTEQLFSPAALAVIVQQRPPKPYRPRKRSVA